MPATCKPSPELVGCNSDRVVRSPEDLLRATSRAWAPSYRRANLITGKRDEPEKRPILQSSFGDLNPASLLIPYGNGMVNGIIRAFQQDLHLILRPDDVWLSIVTQFSFFVNANSEFLQPYFVAHEGEQNLTIDVRPFSVSNFNMGKFAQEVTHLIQQNVVDIELRDWIIPNFSTTTDNDKSVAAIVMMGTLESYFTFALSGGCGFPSVTLLGERSDWEQILRKVRKLPMYGNQTTEWSRLLIPVVNHMIATFDAPDSQDVKDFWLRACHFDGQNGSAETKTLSGWITVFCFWSEDGKRVEDFSDQKLTSVVDHKKLILDDVAYPVISPKSIPASVVSVPVAVEDHASGLKHQTTMVAGSVGMTATVVGGEKETTVQPRSGWWILEDSARPIQLAQCSTISRVNSSIGSKSISSTDPAMKSLCLGCFGPARKVSRAQFVDDLS